LTNTGSARIRPFVIVSDTLGVGEIFAIGNNMHRNVSTNGKVTTVFKNIAIYVK